MTRRGAALLQAERQQAHGGGECGGFEQIECNGANHFFFSVRPRAFSMARMSDSVSLPASIKWDITGSAEPPKRSRRSLIKRRWTARRVKTASKTWALRTFFTRRTA